MNRALSRAVLTTVVAAALVSTTGTAHAYHGDRIGAASHGIKGHTSRNFRTHVWTTIIGTYKYERVLRHGGRRHHVRFRGIVVSAQHCTRDHCWGAAKERRLWSPHQLGKAPRRVSVPQADAVKDFCLSPAGVHCAATWNWSINDPVSKGLKAVRTNLIQPCAGGALAGFGVKVAERTAGSIVAESGVLAAGERAAGVFGPEGFAVGAMAGCFVGVGAHGWTNIKSIASTLNPFDRAAARRGAQHERR